MAAEKTTAAKKASVANKPANLKGLKGACLTAMTKMENDGRKVQVIGRVKNGKVEFDPASLQELAKRFPEANMAFVAVNAPFDPVSQPAG